MHQADCAVPGLVIQKEPIEFDFRSRQSFIDNKNRMIVLLQDALT